ncbi:MAG TPA: hypothetical protein GX513_05980, partial [Firmicutes bacterium]|nr:hypothetical protein [Bacillota bacterium]
MPMAEIGQYGQAVLYPMSQKKKKELPLTPATPIRAASPVLKVAPTPATPATQRPADIQGWMEANRAKLEEAYAAAGKPSPWQQTASIPSAVSKATSQAVKIPSVPGTYNPYTDPRFARMMQQLE